MDLVQMKWVAIAGFVLLWCLFGGFYFGSRKRHQSQEPRGNRGDTLKFVSFWFAGFGIMFSTLLTSFNSLEATQRSDTQMEFQRTENAFSYMQRWDSPPMHDARDVTRTIKDLAAGGSL